MITLLPLRPVALVDLLYMDATVPSEACLTTVERDRLNHPRLLRPSEAVVLSVVLMTLLVADRTKPNSSTVPSKVTNKAAVTI
jgi:hypothetical protein